MTQEYSGHGRPGRSPSPRLPPLQEHRPPQEHRPQEHRPPTSSSEAWSDAFARLQSQVQYNSHAIEETRRHMNDFHAAVVSMQSEITGLWQHLDMCKEKIYARLEESDKRPNPNDVDFLMSQHQAVSNKAHEIDGMKVQLELMVRRLQRLEGQAPRNPIEVSYDVQQSAPLQPPQLAPQYPQHQQQHPPPQHQHAPQPQGHHPAPPADARYAPPATLTHEARPAGERVVQTEAQSVPGFRAFDAAPTGTSWRPAAGTAPASYPPQAAAHPQAANNDPSRPAHHEPNTASSGWAAVNANAVKRPASIDTGAPHDSSAPTSPKRQKLAPLMPRGSVAEQGGHSAAAPHPDMATHASAQHAAEQEAAYHANAANANIRFVPFPRDVSTAVHESWRSDESARSRPRGVGRSRGGRRGKSASVGGERDETEPRTEWATTNGADPYHQHYATSPADAARDPHQPITYSPSEAHSGSQIPDTPSPAYNADSANKKSRAKPTRNAHGVLIRKDGRPDMRSVSSAQNLRKVHAKKEAERHGEGGSAGDPNSATSSAMTGGSVDGKSEGEEESPTTPVDQREKGYEPTAGGWITANAGFRRGESYTPETRGQSVDGGEAKMEYGQARGKSAEPRAVANGQREGADSVMMDVDEGRREQRDAVGMAAGHKANALTA